ncbi:ATP-binding protein [Mycoplasmatota bacterium]|nr:ATP-binding protein [Mycoplasmatota bacterium]
MKKISDYFINDGSVVEIKKELLSNSVIDKLIRENNISNHEVESKLSELYRYVNEVTNCKGCRGLEECKMDIVGFYPCLSADKSLINVEYKQCDFYRVEYQRLKRKNQLVSMYMPRKDYVDFEPTKERGAIIDYITDFLQNDEYMKGIYLHGKPGVGKTRILTVTAKKVAKNKKVLFVNYPDFVREIKSSINEGTLESKVEYLKNIEVLILDDFGDEGLSSDWFRDEVLMPILQNRMSQKKPVFFGSNFSIKHLEDNFNSKVSDPVKVERLMERIRAVSKPFELKGKNYRE